MKNLLTILFLILSFGVLAQTPGDSIYFFNQDLNKINLDQTNSTFLLNSKIENAGFSKLFYNKYGGGYRLAQQAQNNTQAGIFSQGITKFGKFKTSGYFRFMRTWQDSLAWSTKGLEEDDQPYYYGSIKAGAFERINYELGGNASYNLIKDKLFVGGGIKYLYNNSTRSVDPRPKVNSFNIKISPEITYQVKNHFIGINAIWGYGTEVTSIGFKNLDYAKSTLGYPDRVNYLIQGYGLYANSQGISEPLRRLDKYYGLGINYTTGWANYNIRAQLNYEARQEDFYQDLDESVNRAYVGLFDTDNINAYFQIDKNSKNISHQIILSYNEQYSSDINTLFYAVNYRYNQKMVLAKYLIHVNKTEKISPEFGLEAPYKKVEKKDYSTAHLVNFSWIEPTISTTLYYIINKENRFSGTIGVGYRKPMSSQIDIPKSQETLFTNWVVYPDFTYNTSAAFKVSGKMNLITSSIFKSFKTGLSLEGTYYSKDKTNNLFPTSKAMLGNNYFNINCALNLYF